MSEFEKGQQTPLGLVSKKINIGRRITTIRLEPALWNGLDEICRREGWTRDEAVAVAQGEQQQMLGTLRSGMGEIPLSRR